MFSLRPWLVRIEAGLTRLLYAESANRQLFVKFDLGDIQRGAPAERMNIYSIGLQQGIYSIDEVRAREDLEPLPDGLGEAHRVPLNLADVATPPDEPKTTEPPPDNQSDNEGETDADRAKELALAG